MKRKRWLSCLWITLGLVLGSTMLCRADDRLVGIWTLDEGFQTVELLFRADGRYQIDTKSTDPTLDFSSTERGRYEVSDQMLALTSYDYLGTPQSLSYEFQVVGSSLSLTRIDIPISQVYEFRPSSKEDVLAKQNVDQGLVGTWRRHIVFSGTEEYTFRPDGHYSLKYTPDDSQFPPEFIRGRFTRTGTRLTIKPYSSVEAEYEIDVFGTTLTLINQSDTSGHSTAYAELAGSEAEVVAKSAQAQAFLGTTNWQVGVWEIRDEVNMVDLTLRPDGRYMATNDTALLRGLVRGHYHLESGQISLSPFVGQGLYSRDNGDFGKVERVFELDYYDGELQIIITNSISQSVTIAHKRPGSDVIVLDKTRQAQLEQARGGWYVGIWEVNDPAGWMELTYRPDKRYIAQSGTGGVPSQVERGRYLVGPEKLTMAPYSGLAQSRGFELDFYDGDLLLAGDLSRLVVARKEPGSDLTVIEKTQNPGSMKGERGSILGLWTANLPGEYDELVFRPDGQFRLNRCVNSAVSQDYGFYSANLAARSLVYDSRFVPVQSQGLDFYGNTLTIFGGFGAPATYTVNLGSVDAAIAASHAADTAEGQVDVQWLSRVPIGPRDPNAVQVPTGDLPTDPNPTHLFNSPTVLTNYQLYRRLIPGWAYFNVNGKIESVAVVNTREWHFFPTGRVLIRFKNYYASPVYPITLLEVSSSWGAYRVESKPAQTDILHFYADNAVLIETDLGEKAELTLEDGRRNLFWDKDYMILSEWATEQKPILCQGGSNLDPSLMNTGVSLSTSITPDVISDSGLVPIKLSGSVSANFTLSGTAEFPATLVIEQTSSLTPPILWQPLLTNSVASGPFQLQIPQTTNTSGFFRLRQQ
jgi:hypothetical protein